MTNKRSTFKIIIERDYSYLDGVKFIESCPVSLKDKIDLNVFCDSIKKINKLLDEASKNDWAVTFDNLLSIFSFFITHLVLDSKSTRQMALLVRCIDELNQNVFHPKKMHLINPLDTGLLQVYIVNSYFSLLDRDYC